MTTAITDQVDRVEAATEIGYSYDRYSRAGWRQAIRVLLTRGYDEREVEAIMRSKWTRWAADNYDARYGNTPGVALIRFIDDPRTRCTKREVAELVTQTYGS